MNYVMLSRGIQLKLVLGLALWGCASGATAQIVTDAQPAKANTEALANAPVRMPAIIVTATRTEEESFSVAY